MENPVAQAMGRTLMSLRTVFSPCLSPRTLTLVSSRSETSFEQDVNRYQSQGHPNGPAKGRLTGRQPQKPPPSPHGSLMAPPKGGQPCPTTAATPINPTWHRQRGDNPCSTTTTIAINPRHGNASEVYACDNGVPANHDGAWE